MTDAEQGEAARQFANKWIGQGKEDEDGRSYWLDFLTDVMGIANDKAVMQAYGFSLKMSESDCVAELMKMYQNLVDKDRQNK